MKNNQQGSVLLWAIMIIMVILISLGTCLTISFSYLNRSIQNQVKQQAYYTAHSGMMAITKLLSDEKQSAINQFVPVNNNEKVEVTNISFRSGNDEIDELGNATAVIEKISEVQLKVTVIGSMGGETSKISGDLLYQKDEENVDKWQLIQLYDADDRLIQKEDE